MEMVPPSYEQDLPLIVSFVLNCISPSLSVEFIEILGWQLYIPGRQQCGTLYGAFSTVVAGAGLIAQCNGSCSQQ